MRRLPFFILLLSATSCNSSDQANDSLDRAPTNADAYVEVSQLLAKGMTRSNKDISVHGFVKIGSIRNHESETHFTIEESGAELSVIHRGPLPDAFQERAEVFSRGRMTAQGRFESSQVIAKCPSRYQGSSGPDIF